MGVSNVSFTRTDPKNASQVCELGGQDGAIERERERNVLFNDALNTFSYGYMASDTWLRTILIVRKETCCRHMGNYYRLTARVLLYAPSHRQDSTYHGICYTSRGALAGMRNSSMGPPHEGSIRRPLPLSYVPDGAIDPLASNRFLRVKCRASTGVDLVWYVSISRAGLSFLKREITEMRIKKRIFKKQAFFTTYGLKTDGDF